MDDSSLAGAFLSGGEFLDMETSVSRPYGSNVNQNNQPMLSSMDMLTGLDNDSFKDLDQKSFQMDFDKGMGIAQNQNTNGMSEDDEPSYNECGSGENTGGRKGKNGTPWHRMKWTDNDIRVLISVVACVGDDGSFDVAEGLKRKTGALQKKGKWKTVSKIMITKGCHISPQQCEDKFNDLNKRYKKLNDILGRGNSCRVVENPKILDSMRNIPAKMKEDVKKILNSKHLFYQEMRAYHNGERIPNCGDLDLPFNPMPVNGHSKDSEEEGEEQGKGFFASEEDESDYENHHYTGGDSKSVRKYNGMVKQNEEASWPHPSGNLEIKQYKEDGSLWPQHGVSIGLEAEIAEVSENPMKSSWERKQSIQKQILHLKEQRVCIQAEAFELEQRNFKWRRFRNKKETELERSRLDNDRMRLENERMVLHLKHKELELNFETTGASLDPGLLSIDKSINELGKPV